MKDSLNPDFSVKVSGLTKKTELVAAATDVYDNTKKIIYTIEKTEINKPVVALLLPILPLIMKLRSTILTPNSILKEK